MTIPHTSFLITLLFTLVSFTFNANAEFLCRSEILYKWSRENDASKEDLKAKTPGADPAKTEETSKSPATTDLTVFWTNIEQKGSSENDAKQKVNKAVPEERANAERACLAAHENLAGCIAAKYTSLSPSVSTLSFSAKKAVDEAIKADCEKQQGKCTGSTVGEIKCGELLTDAKPTEPAKDSKGKKK